MLTLARLIGLLTATDTGEAKAFYAGTLGLPLLEDSRFGLVFDANGTKLRIHKVSRIHVHPHTACDWEVKDIEATAAELSAEGVVFERYEGMSQDAYRIWTAPSGTRIAWFKDPAGNTLSLSQPSAKK